MEHPFKMIWMMTGGSPIFGNRHMLMFLESEDESQDKIGGHCFGVVWRIPFSMAGRCAISRSWSSLAPWASGILGYLWSLSNKMGSWSGHLTVDIFFFVKHLTFNGCPSPVSWSNLPDFRLVASCLCWKVCWIDEIEGFQNFTRRCWPFSSIPTFPKMLTASLWGGPHVPGFVDASTTRPLELEEIPVPGFSRSGFFHGFFHGFFCQVYKLLQLQAMDYLQVEAVPSAPAPPVHHRRHSHTGVRGARGGARVWTKVEGD